MKNKSKKGIVIIVAMMLLIIPNMSVYSAVGNYNSKSIALSVNEQYNTYPAMNKEIFFPAVLAVAAGVGLLFVAGFGFADGWNSHHKNSNIGTVSYEDNYNKYDFEEFNN